MTGEVGEGNKKSNPFGVRPELDHLTQVEFGLIWSITGNRGKV